jgi:hypothetical protein
MANSKHVAAASLLGAVLVGGVLGFTTARVMNTPESIYLESRRKSMSELLAHDLGLGVAQGAQLDSILDRRARDMRAVMAPVRPQLDSIRNRARDEIRRMLTDEQRAKFERILAAQERDREEQEKDR